MHDFQGQGFHLAATKREPITLALISLKTALKSYFGTFKDFQNAWSLLDDDEPSNKSSLESFYRRSRDGMQYFENYIETVIHFHHFIEIICIELLRMEHSLLPTESCKDKEGHKDVYKRVKKLPNDPNTRITDHTIGFDSAVKRLCVLINDQKISNKVWLGNKNLSFFDDKTKTSLLRLLKLRNALLHQGTFVLKYEELDLFIGTEVLPFVVKVVELPEFNTYKRLWKYNDIACKKKNGENVDPISDIIAICGTSYERGHVGLLKEIGRSAYLNLIPENEPPRRGFGSSSQNVVRLNAYKLAAEALKREDVASVTDCLVCGVKTLVLYRHSEIDTPDSIVAAECTNCSFCIDIRLRNLLEYEINMPDIWIEI
jgi:hypothetical protein